MLILKTQRVPDFCVMLEGVHCLWQSTSLFGIADEVKELCDAGSEVKTITLKSLCFPRNVKKMGWEHKLIVLLHTVILVTLPDSTFLPGVK